ncbi:MAG: aminodeoxychorismate/anthranilate synthase component II [Bacteroidia bacterium]
MLLLLDNYDSFTWNLRQYLAECTGEEVVVYRNDELDVEDVANFSRIVLSPGPGLPAESGILLPVIRTYAATKPILGVCLGHQAITEAFGGKLRQLDQVLHGVVRKVRIVETDPLFDGIPDEFPAGRYHSWVPDESSFPATLKVLATGEDGSIMALRHVELPVFGVQYHPESVMTPTGKQLIANWLRISAS